MKILIPRKIAALGGLHAWVYSNIYSDSVSEHFGHWRAYTARGIALSIGLNTRRGIIDVSAALREICEFLECWDNGTYILINLDTLPRGDIEVSYSDLCKIVASGEKNKFQLLQFYLIFGSGEDFKCSSYVYRHRMDLLQKMGIGVTYEEKYDTPPEDEKMPWEDEDYEMPDDVSKRLHTSKNILPSSAIKSGWTAASAADIDDILPFN